MIIEDPALIRSYAAELGIEDKLPALYVQTTDLSTEALQEAAETRTYSIKKMNGEPGPFFATVPIRHKGLPAFDLKTRLEVDLKKGRHVLFARDTEHLSAYAFGDGYDPEIIRSMAAGATHAAIFVGDQITNTHWAWNEESYEKFHWKNIYAPSIRDILVHCLVSNRLPENMNDYQFALDIPTVHPTKNVPGYTSPFITGVSYHFEYSSSDPDAFLMYAGKPPKGVKPEDVHEHMEREHFGHKHFSLRELPNHTFP